MDVYQCPECELRFRFSSELRSHLETDHPEFEVHPKTIEDALLSESHQHRHPSRRSINQDPPRA
jgi:hypothetical protein